MVGDFLVIQMQDASDKRSVILRFRPIDCFFLGFEGAELMVRMVFNYIILSGRPAVRQGDCWVLNGSEPSCPAHRTYRHTRCLQLRRPRRPALLERTSA